MIARLRKQLGSPGILIGTIALIAALAGGAYAAGKVIITNKNQIASKVRKELKGNAGPAGPQGTPGAKGDTGAKGEKGDVGNTGPTGKSVVLGTATVGECEPGGITVEVEGTPASKKEVCNGMNGAIQPGETLPPEATETGSFAALVEGESLEPISFPIPLTSALPEANVHKTGDTGFASDCPGSAASPEAEPGNLCIYIAAQVFGSVTINGIFSSAASASEFGEGKQGASTSGAFLYLSSPGVLAWGSWAVTAE